MSRIAALALSTISALMLTGFSGDTPAITGTLQISVGAACGGLAVLLFNLHRHSVRSEARHVEQEGRLASLHAQVAELEHQLQTVLSLLRRNLHD